MGKPEWEGTWEIVKAKFEALRISMQLDHIEAINTGNPHPNLHDIEEKGNALIVWIDELKKRLRMRS